MIQHENNGETTFFVVAALYIPWRTQFLLISAYGKLKFNNGAGFIVFKMPAFLTLKQFFWFGCPGNLRHELPDVRIDGAMFGAINRVEETEETVSPEILSISSPDILFPVTTEGASRLTDATDAMVSPEILSKSSPEILSFNPVTTERASRLTVATDEKVSPEILSKSSEILKPDDAVVAVVSLHIDSVDERSISWSRASL